jgi:hypothetical protein
MFPALRSFDMSEELPRALGRQGHRRLVSARYGQ